MMVFILLGQVFISFWPGQIPELPLPSGRNSSAGAKVGLHG